ncbi:putative mip family channel protein [Venturia nashicola]|uniref:Putative mip family channel protein n=1 Tax=Venturia nashicola TaxID=86259 RepID=A0A4Z1PCP8_9PEZI|nr:putative mip family channel protein [Venturia nashicola]
MHPPTTPPRLPLPIRTSHPPSPSLPSPAISTEKMNNRIGWALFLNSSIKNHLVATIGELIGTTMFLFFAFAGTVVANINSPTEAKTTTGLTTGWNVTKLLYIAFSFGFSLIVNVWIFFRISGGLFNPAVTLALLLTGAIGFVRALFLFFAQIAGSIAASGLIVGLFPTATNVRTTLSPGLSISKGLFIEAFLTAELVFTILMLAKEKHKATFIAPVGIGLSLFIAELVGVYWTGGSLNPARSIGPSIVTWTWDRNHWIYWLGPGLGSLLAVGFYALIKALEYELANPGQDSDSAASPSPERTMQDRQEQVRRRLMGAMGYDIVDQRGSVEYENLGKSEMGLMKPGVVYSRDGMGGRDGAFGGPGVVGERASAYVAGHGRGGSRSDAYTAAGGPAPQFGSPLGTAVRNSGEIGQEEGFAVRDMEYESGASGRKSHGRRGK